MPYILSLQPWVDIQDGDPVISYATLDTETGTTETGTRRMPNVSQNDAGEYEVQQIMSRAAPCFPVDGYWKSESEMIDRIIAYQSTHEGGYDLYPENTGGKAILKALFTPLRFKHFLEREGDEDSGVTLSLREILTDEGVVFAYEQTMERIDSVKRALESSVSHVETQNAWESFCLGLCFAEVKRMNREDAEREATFTADAAKRKAEREKRDREQAEREAVESKEQDKTRDALELTGEPHKSTEPKPDQSVARAPRPKQGKALHMSAKEREALQKTIAEWEKRQGDNV